MLEQSEKLAERARWVQDSRLKYAEIKQRLTELKQEEAFVLAEIRKGEQKNAWEAEFVMLGGELRAAEKQFSEAQTNYEELDAMWQHEQAAILALTLVDGDACPVCGSMEHPNVALETSGVTKTEVDTAREGQSARQDALKAIAVKVEQKKWQIEQIVFASEESLQVLKDRQVLYGEELAEKEKKLTEMDDFLAEESGVEEQLERNKQDMIKLGEEKGKLQTVYEEVSKSVDAAKTTYALLLEDVPEEFQNPAVFYEQQKTLTTKITDFEEKKGHSESAYNAAKEGHYKTVSVSDMAGKAVLKADDALIVQRTIFKDIMAANGFADYVSYQRAILSPELLDEKERFIRDFEQRYHFVSERLKEMEARLAGIEQPDLKELQRLDDEAKRAYHEKAELWMGQKDAARKLSELSERFLKYLVETSEAEKAYADIGYLADMARGKNDRRLTFERFVLATFLDTILLRANGRLKKMTNGRFQLNRKKEKSKGNVQSGLELEVYDEYTGLERHVKTLSGGESFKTSLSLALALAEVVQEMSGGISLETMFIDEGFGTLDPESLEMAVECLLETQESGRLVGIISHVPELKERIPSRLEVTATNHGSTTKFFAQGL
ncbi:exonuclease, SbcC family protein [Listeria cornellensis FSL F6-0969]|uniref:Nuclease SbcCD subunit C n=1 Tax=Listeria cornellensis FSL F6-0969 TaxID=1265820 RepID=W7BVW1_9LIST|nr:SbcC/MukB-like Walker B domain-containing protein [Listeria cornellensis]EUJ30899.1 exonuclease, SbcC family protein [Listeria cornellensis FSL F6-0969]